MADKFFLVFVGVILATDAAGQANEIVPSKTIENHVGYIFNGGSIIYTYSDQVSSKRLEMKMSFPGSDRDPFAGEPDDENAAGEFSLKSAPVFELTNNGDRTKPHVLKGKVLRDWANARVAQLAGTESLREEQAFIALATFLSSTDCPVHVWGSRGMRLLNKGRWIDLLDERNSSAYKSGVSDAKKTSTDANLSENASHIEASP